MAKKQIEKEEVVDSVKIAAENFFKSNKEHIYTEELVSEPFTVSTGIIGLDTMLGGGIPSGILCRLLGPPTSGKSSEGLLVVKNFLETRKKARGLIIPTEARLTAKLQSRSGVKFVHDPADWVNGTCLILPTNVYERIANFLWTLVKTNELHKKEDRENFVVMIDCMDYLHLEDDLKKGFGENFKIAGPQYLTKKIWAKMALPFNAGQHLFLAISQQSAAPKIDPYAKDPLRQGGSSGGTNVQYQASLVLDFNTRYEGDYILTDPDAKYDERKNPKIGHIVKGIVRKSDNEKYDTKFEYAVKYGRTDGNSIWVEKDVLDQIITWGLLGREGGKEKGSLCFEDSVFKELEAIDPECPEKFRGLNAALKFLESSPKVTQFLNEKLKATLC